MRPVPGVPWWVTDDGYWRDLANALEQQQPATNSQIGNEDV